MKITYDEELLHEAGEAKHKADWIVLKMAEHYPKWSREAHLAEALSKAADKLYYHFLLEVTNHGE